MPQYYLPFPICQLSNVEFKYDLTIKKIFDQSGLETKWPLISLTAK